MEFYDQDIPAMGDLGFSLNPAKVAQRHIAAVRAMVKRHATITRKMVKRHVSLVRRPVSDVRKMRTGSGTAKPRGMNAPEFEDGEYYDSSGNVVPYSELYNYTDENGNPLGPLPPDGGSEYEDSFDARRLLTLPTARIRELAQAGAGYPGSGETAQVLLDRERSLYRPFSWQDPLPTEDLELPDYEPAPRRTIYGVEHTPMDFAQQAPPYYGPESPNSPWMSETDETAWSDRDALYPAESSSDAGPSNYGPSFAEDAYGSDALSGLYDIAIGDPLKFWSQKWKEAKAKLSAALVAMSGTAAKLETYRSVLNSAIDATSNSRTISADGIASLERARQTLVALENNQSNLEGRARGVALEMKRTAEESPEAGLGVFPIVAVGVILATVVGIVAAVVVHTQNVNALGLEIQAVIAGKISASDLQKIQGGGGLPGFSLPGIGAGAAGLGMLAIVFAGAFFLLNRKR